MVNTPAQTTTAPGIRSPHRLAESLILGNEGALWSLVLADFHDGLRACPATRRAAYCRRWIRFYTKGRD